MRRTLLAAAIGAVAALAVALPVATGASTAPPAPAHLVPGCHWKLIEQNSGSGPNWHVVVCDADDPVWVVDGGPLVNGAVVFGFPR